MFKTLKSSNDDAGMDFPDPIEASANATDGAFAVELGNGQLQKYADLETAIKNIPAAGENYKILQGNATLVEKEGDRFWVEDTVRDTVQSLIPAAEATVPEVSSGDELTLDDLFEYSESGDASLLASKRLPEAPPVSVTARLEPTPEEKARFFKAIDSAASDEAVEYTAESPLPAFLKAIGTQGDDASAKDEQSPSLDEKPKVQVPASPVAGKIQAGGSMAGQVISSVLALPFNVVANSIKGVKSKLAGAGNSLVSGRMPASLVPPELMPSAQFISGWKLDRIVKSGQKVQQAANDLTGTPEFLIYEEAVKNTATQHELGEEEIVRDLVKGQKFEDVRQAADAMWKAHPDKVKAYRESSKEFERNITSIKDEFVNSTEETMNSIMKAVSDSSNASKTLPGFSEDEGLYHLSMREKLASVMDAIRSIFGKLLNMVAPSNNQSNTPSL